MTATHKHVWGPRKGWGRIWAVALYRMWPEATAVCVYCGKDRPIPSKKVSA